MNRRMLWMFGLVVVCAGGWTGCGKGKKKDPPLKLHPVSRQLAGELQGRMEALVFVSEKLPSELADLSRFAVRLLRSYAKHSQGPFKVTVLSPDTSNKAKRQAETYGIPRMSFRLKKGDLCEAFFGVALRYRPPGASTDRVEVVRVIEPNMRSQLEYLFTERLLRLVRGRQRLLLLTGHHELLPRQKSAFLKVLAKLFGAFEAVQYNIAAKGPPPKAPVALVLPPNRPWSLEEKKRLDQLVLRGTNLLVLLEGMALQKQPPAAASQRSPRQLVEAKHGLGDLLVKWGVRVQPAYVMDSEARPLMHRRGEVTQSIEHPALLSISIGGTKLMARPMLASPLTLTKDLVGARIQPGKTFRVQPLLVTSPRSWLVKGPYVFNAKRRDRPPTGTKLGRFVVAAMVEGRLPSAYVIAPELGKLVRGAKPSRLVVVGDFDLLKLSPHVPANRIFLQNILDWLAQSELLKPLRVRTLPQP